MNPADFYAASNLNDNPFRPSPTGVEDPRAAIWVGYERQQELLEKILQRVRADQVGITSFILLFGHWGTGKSHALLWARHWIKKSASGIAYYLPTLKRDKGKLSLASAIREDLVDRGIVIDDLKRFHIWLQNQMLRVKNANPGMSNEDAIRRLYQTKDIADLANAVVHADGNDAALRTILTDQLASEYEAVTLLSKIVNMFVTAIGEKPQERFSPAVYLLIDELDDLQRQPPKDSLNTNDTIRHLFDSCPNSFGLVLAASAELNTLQHLFTEYVLTRMTRKIEFEFLDQDAAKAFVKDVLDSNRVDKKAAEKRGYFPFTEEAVAEVISHLRQITPRSIVNTMQQLLEEARIADVNPEKGALTAEILEKKDLLGFIFDS